MRSDTSLGTRRVRWEVRQVLMGTESVVRCWEGEEGRQTGAGRAMGC